MKPKEFWIIGQEVYNCEQLEEPLAFHAQQIRVIEYSAYEKLVKALEEINRYELSAQRPGGGHSRSATISYEVLQDIKKV